MAFLCDSQQGEFNNTIKTFWRKFMSKTFGQKPKKLGEKTTFFLSSFPFGFFYRVFGRFAA
jgi:hypothetical protein